MAVVNVFNDICLGFIIWFTTLYKVMYILSYKYLIFVECTEIDIFAVDISAVQPELLLTEYMS